MPIKRGATSKLFRRDEDGFERIVMAELLIPDVPNVYGDITTKEAIREFVEVFAAQGYEVDIDHDQNNVEGQKLLVVESFIARPGDPDFVEGAWVVALKILDDETWEKVLNNELNGFSYEANVWMSEVEYEILTSGEIEGVTEAYVPDGHTHTYFAIVNDAGRIIAGGTGVTDGHSHTISGHTVTDEAEGHTHRIQLIPKDK